jgi:hypothetical protein
LELQSRQHQGSLPTNGIDTRTVLSTDYLDMEDSRQKASNGDQTTRRHKNSKEKRPSHCLFQTANESLETMPSETLRYLLALWIVSLSVMSIGFILSGPRASPLPRGYFLVDNTSDSLVAAAAAAAAAVYVPRPVGWWGLPSTSISQQPRFLRGSDATSRRESDTLAHEFWMYTNTNTEHILTHTSGNSRHPTSQVTAVPQSERDHNDPQTVWLKADEVSEKTLFVCREVGRRLPRRLGIPTNTCRKVVSRVIHSLAVPINRYVTKRIVSRSPLHDGSLFKTTAAPQAIPPSRRSPCVPLGKTQR